MTAKCHNGAGSTGRIAVDWRKIWQKATMTDKGMFVVFCCPVPHLFVTELVLQVIDVTVVTCVNED
jgi:hypothetical protein